MCIWSRTLAEDPTAGVVSNQTVTNHQELQKRYASLNEQIELASKAMACDQLTKDHFNSIKQIHADLSTRISNLVTAIQEHTISDNNSYVLQGYMNNLIDVIKSRGCNPSVLQSYVVTECSQLLSTIDHNLKHSVNYPKVHMHV